jgi:hypothetical protein
VHAAGSGGDDSAGTTARRGEAYMFWCLDRPSRGAGLAMHPQSTSAAPPAGVPAWAAAAAAAGNDGGDGSSADAAHGGPRHAVAL